MQRVKVASCLAIIAEIRSMSPSSVAYHDNTPVPTPSIELDVATELPDENTPSQDRDRSHIEAVTSHIDIQNTGNSGLQSPLLVSFSH